MKLVRSVTTEHLRHQRRHVKLLNRVSYYADVTRIFCCVPNCTQNTHFELIFVCLSKMEAAISSRIAKQYNMELKLLKSLSLCYHVSRNADTSRGQMQDALEDLNVESADNLLKKNFRSVDLLDTIFCMFDTTFKMSSGLPEADERILKMLAKIYNGSQPQETDLFMLKSSQVDDRYSSVDRTLMHEFFVGSMFTNRLRRFVPNFAYILGGFKLNKPIVPVECPIGDVTCDTSQEIDYIMYEKVSGITMTEALMTCSTGDFMSWMIQITLALEMAVSQFGFTHYNLHTGNVIIREIKQPSWEWINGKKGSSVETAKGKAFHIPYFHNNSIFMVKATKIPTIWNYQVSHVKYWSPNVEATHFGSYEHLQLGIYPKEARPFYDIYKLLMSSMSILLKHNRKVFDEVKQITKFFGFETMASLQNSLIREKRFGYIYNTKISNLEKRRNLGDFLRYMVAVSPKARELIVSADEFKLESDVVSCDGYCPTAEQNIQYLTSPKPLDLFANLKDILLRDLGLFKRSEELKRMDSESIEAKSAKMEHRTFHDMVDRKKYALRAVEVKKIEKHASLLAERLSWQHKDANRFYTGKQEEIPVEALTSMVRDRKSIEKMANDVNDMIQVLKHFDKVYEIMNGAIPSIPNINSTSTDMMISSVNEKALRAKSL